MTDSDSRLDISGNAAFTLSSPGYSLVSTPTISVLQEIHHNSSPFLSSYSVALAEINFVKTLQVFPTQNKLGTLSPPQTIMLSSNLQNVGSSVERPLGYRTGLRPSHYLYLHGSELAQPPSLAVWEYGSI
ncbi:hypothetical protein SERLA73DRAFT_79430 [Serpula lacrymans var. lacrymans S7.3]|uniref:Uncharacterized protein n=1 Tax=Serpula lacrymans var. lacrymans (strain S7.3) TaxID=936435 RepID=F8QGD6_SERL3|nr:hypothetical protein SERLA73DRAFT_79430 [Serpula lacrymans var. lacrymans S7.3]